MNEQDLKYEVKSSSLSSKEQVVLRVRSLHEEHPDKFIVSGISGEKIKTFKMSTLLRLRDGKEFRLQLERLTEDHGFREIIYILDDTRQVYRLDVGIGSRIQEKYDSLKNHPTLPREITSALLEDFSTSLGKEMYWLQGSIGMDAAEALKILNEAEVVLPAGGGITLAEFKAGVIIQPVENLIS